MNANNVIKRLKDCLANSAGLVHDEKQAMLDAIQYINELEHRLETQHRWISVWRKRVDKSEATVERVSALVPEFYRDELMEILNDE